MAAFGTKSHFHEEPRGAPVTLLGRLSSRAIFLSTCHKQKRHLRPAGPGQPGQYRARAPEVGRTKLCNRLAYILYICV